MKVPSHRTILAVVPTWSFLILAAFPLLHGRHVGKSYQGVPWQAPCVQVDLRVRRLRCREPLCAGVFTTMIETIAGFAHYYGTYLCSVVGLDINNHGAHCVHVGLELFSNNTTRFRSVCPAGQGRHASGEL